MAASHVGVVAGVVSAITGVLALVLAGMQYVHDRTGVGPAPFEVIQDWVTGRDGSGTGTDTGSPTGGGGGVTIPPIDTAAPSTPQNLRIEARNGCSLTLRWDRSEDNVGVQNYRLYDGSQLAGLVEGQFTSFEVLMFPGEEAKFAVLASDGRSNESGLSNVVLATPC